MRSCQRPNSYAVWHYQKVLPMIPFWRQTLLWYVSSVGASSDKVGFAKRLAGRWSGRANSTSRATRRSIGMTSARCTVLAVRRSALPSGSKLPAAPSKAPPPSGYASCGPVSSGRSRHSAGGRREISTHFASDARTGFTFNCKLACNSDHQAERDRRTTIQIKRSFLRE